MSNHTTLTYQDVEAARARFQGRHVHATDAELTAELTALAADWIVRKLSEPGRWTSDPEVDNVWGWQPEGMSGRNVALVYYRHEADFECDEDWGRAQ